jgi:hypothetical protein
LERIRGGDVLIALGMALERRRGRRHPVARGIRSQTNPKETLDHVYIEIFVWSKCLLLRQSIRFRDSSNRSSSGSTIASDFFEGLDFWRRQLTDIEIHPWLIYGGETRQDRDRATVLPWTDLSPLLDAISSAP